MYLIKSVLNIFWYVCIYGTEILHRLTKHNMITRKKEMSLKVRIYFRVLKKNHEIYTQTHIQVYFTKLFIEIA